MIILYVILALFSINSNASVIGEIGDVGPRLISLKYYEGSFLMYDCQENHWVCTNKDTFNNCVVSYEESIHEGGKRTCIPYQSYEELPLCLAKQQSLINSNIDIEKICFQSK